MDIDERLRFLTVNYFSLQGLRFTPFWLFFVFRPWLEAVPDRRPVYLRDWLTFSMLLLCGVWIWLAGKLYHRRYGRVQSNPWPWWRILFFAAAIAVYFVCYQADYKNQPVSFTAIWWTCILAARAIGQAGSELRRTAYSLSGVCMFMLALLPFTARISSGELLDAYHPSGAIVLGALMATLGIIDHFELVRLISTQSRSAHA